MEVPPKARWSSLEGILILHPEQYPPRIGIRSGCFPLLSLKAARATEALDAAAGLTSLLNVGSNIFFFVRAIFCFPFSFYKNKRTGSALRRFHPLNVAECKVSPSIGSRLGECHAAMPVGEADSPECRRRQE